MKIIIGADHGGFRMKERLLGELREKGHEVTDMGVDSEESAHYPDVALAACSRFLKGSYDFGVLICGTGIGISISANKIDGIRCANLCGVYAARMAKAHNNANFIAFGGRITYSEPVGDMIDAYMNARFEEGRHKIRVDKITALERGDLS